ncbi:MAG TPA: hypothetical protein HA346_00025 [Thermoplasmata archaeon]|nr:hypothetical protein [Thermoplasmata archaeon]
MKPKYLLIPLSAGLIFILYFVAGLSNPVELNSCDPTTIANYENRIVRLRGTVTESRITDTGSQLLQIKNREDTVMVFLQNADPGISEGDVIVAKGKIQNYRGEWELLVATDKDLEVKRNPDRTISLQELASCPARWEQMKVKVTGSVTNPHPHYFYLTTKEGTHRLKVLAPLPTNVVANDSVTVEGFFYWDKEKFSYYLDARSGDCSVIKVGC